MTPSAVIRAALADQNFLAFFAVIRHGESTNDDSAWTLLYGGGHFDGFADHPRIDFPLPAGRTTSAAGAPQIVRTTWDALRKQYPADLPDFSPASQTFATAALIAGRGALDDVLQGRFDAAIAKCRPEWTSLPGAAENNPHWTVEAAKALYSQYGGLFGPQSTGPAVPESPQAGATPPPAIPVPQTQPEAPMGAGLVIGLVQSLLGAFAPQAQAKLGPIINAVAPALGAAPAPPAGVALASQDALLQFVQSIMQTALQVSGHPAPAAATDADKIAATARVLAEPALVAKVQDDALARLDKLGPTFEKLIAIDAATNAASITGKDAAGMRGRLDPWDMARALVFSSEGLCWLIMIALLAALIVQVCLDSEHKPDSTLMTMLATFGGLVFKLRSQPYDYRFDGTPSQNAANAINAEIAAKK